MFDLHIHTTFSDGENKPERIRNMLCDTDVWTVTDHNDIRWHQRYEAPLTGIELFADVMVDDNLYKIELLSYGFDINSNVLEIVDKSKRHLDDAYKGNLLALVEKVKLLGCKIGDDFSPIETGVGYKSIYYRPVYDELTSYPENRTILGDSLESVLSFFQYTQSPKSPVYVGFRSSPYDIRELCSQMRSNGAKLFLAHPCRYRNVNVVKMIRMLKGTIDGVECLHPSANLRDACILLAICSECGLLSSGGSDHHRGYYYGTPYIPMAELYKKQFGWIDEYISFNT